MITFHGTNDQAANQICQGNHNNVNIGLGGGELGRGFYTGENISLARSLALGKFGHIDAKVLEFDTDNSEFARLNVKTIQTKQNVYRSWKNLIKTRRTQTFLYNVDVVCAPFATIGYSYQYKFESPLAQHVINNHSPSKIL